MRLQQRIAKWFEVVDRHKSYLIAADKLNIDPAFFRLFEYKNPFVAVKSFVDFELKAKLTIIKVRKEEMLQIKVSKSCSVLNTHF